MKQSYGCHGIQLVHNDFEALFQSLSFIIEKKHCYF